ncbi:MAG: zinc ribbon domain-containing protein [Frankiaceae bacterium]
MPDPTLVCARCSATIDPGARFCPHCGSALDAPGAAVHAREPVAGGRPGGGGFRLDSGDRGDGGDRGDRGDREPQPAAPAPVARPAEEPRTVAPPPSGAVEGQVRGVQSRSESMGENQSLTVVSFRVERYDESGNRTQLVPVEMRGYKFLGSISDGDWVRVHGKAHGGTLRSDRVENLTTGAVVRAKDVPKAVKVIAIVVFIAVCVFIIGIIVSVVTSS